MKTVVKWDPSNDTQQEAAVGTQAAQWLHKLIKM